MLDELVSGIEKILGQRFIGAYLQGSFAVGDFDQHSDVDFIVVVDSELSSDEIDALQVMHDQIYESGSEWAKHLEGSYFPRAVLRKNSNRGQDLWYLDHGARSLIRSDHCNTILVRSVVRQKGVTLAGPPPKTLVEPIPKELLRAEIFDTMTMWGQQILDEPAKYNNRFYQGYIVLNYCRMLHDLIRGYPGSKRDGAAWAKASLDPLWSDLIDTAWDCRPDPAKQVREPADPEAFARTLRFLEYILNESRRFMSKGCWSEPRHPNSGSLDVSSEGGVVRMTKTTNTKIYLVAAIVFGLAGVINWWRAIEEGLRGRWLIPAVCFTVGAAIWVGVYANARRHARGS